MAIIFCNCICLLILAFCFALSAENPLTSFVKNQILFSMHTGDFNQTLQLYRQHQKELKQHDLELLQQICVTLLDQGCRSHDQEIRILTLFGAGVSGQEKVLYILEEAAASPNPQVQQIALDLLAKSHHDRAEDALQRALNSDNLLIRLEALLYLADMHHPRTTAQAESLMGKLPKEITPFFPQIFASIGDEPSTKALRKLLAHPSEKVRIAAILSAAKFQRDDLLPQIRNLATHGEIAQQESCAWALGKLKDEKSLARLEMLAHSSISSVHLAACEALYQLGQKEKRRIIENQAALGNVFAIALLGEGEGSEELLYRLVRSRQLQIRINAAVALLELGDKRCLAALEEILLANSRDLAFEEITTQGEGLLALRAIPSAKSNLKDDPTAHEISLSIREDILRKTINLPEFEFLKIAQALLENHQNDLVPTLVELLETLHTEGAISILKQFSQKAGAPLIRHFCNLTLFKLNEEGPFEELLRQFIVKTQDQDLIRFRPSLKRDLSIGSSVYSSLTPEENSRLLLSSFEAFAKAQNDKGIDVLLEAMQNGNAKNRFALAGLLIRITL